MACASQEDSVTLHGSVMSTNKKIFIYDTTLRDGAQAEGVSFSSTGKIRLARKLDDFGVDYIEGGYAGSNEKDMEFFRDIKKENLKHAKIAAFGSTRRANTPVAEDRMTACLLEADTEVVTIFGKSWMLHVTEVLRTTEEENQNMIRDTVRFLKENGREVVYDAEHFFDGYKDRPESALATLQAAADGGADCLVLCDTNGGTLPHEVADITQEVIGRFDCAVGIHTHNDAGFGVANSLEAVRTGATQVQGTINGYGERTGNANLITLIPTLELKLGYECVAPGQLKHLTEVSHFLDEILNFRPDDRAPYVGKSSFGHKAGMHVNAVQKLARSFEHIEPELVGNERRVLLSETSGRSNIMMKAEEMGFDLDRSSPEVQQVLDRLTDLEHKGYAFETADGSFRMMVQKALDKHHPFFEVIDFGVNVETRGQEECVSVATVKVKVGDEVEFTVAEAEGPVDALDHALRKALARFYPVISEVHLTDFRVRILDPEEATGATTRVLIESTDGEERWGTVGVSHNIIEASWEALVDSVEYKLHKDHVPTAG